MCVFVYGCNHTIHRACVCDLCVYVLTRLKIFISYILVFVFPSSGVVTLFESTSLYFGDVSAVSTSR